jgi:HK97 family phage prohead protease
MQQFERRYLESSPAVTRAAGSDKRILSGYAARFNVLSQDLGGFKERLLPGCFAASITRDRDVYCLFNHDASKILGHVGNGTLKLSEDDRGLQFRCELANTPTADEVYEHVRSGAITECSFGFRCDDEDWTTEDEYDGGARSQRGRKVSVRNVKRATVLDVSAVAFPAYNGHVTSVSASMAAGAASGRSLWPAGIPAEIRSRYPHIVADPEEAELRRRATLALADVLAREFNL